MPPKLTVVKAAAGQKKGKAKAESPRRSPRLQAAKTKAIDVVTALKQIASENPTRYEEGYYLGIYDLGLKVCEESAVDDEEDNEGQCEVIAAKLVELCDPDNFDEDSQDAEDAQDAVNLVENWQEEFEDVRRFLFTRYKKGYDRLTRLGLGLKTVGDGAKDGAKAFRAVMKILNEVDERHEGETSKVLDRNRDFYEIAKKDFSFGISREMLEKYKGQEWRVPLGFVEHFKELDEGNTDVVIQIPAGFSTKPAFIVQTMHDPIYELMNHIDVDEYPMQIRMLAIKTANYGGVEGGRMGHFYAFFLKE